MSNYLERKAEDEERAARRAHAWELADRARAELAEASPESQARRAKEAEDSKIAARLKVARRFLEGGGVVPWNDWTKLDVPTQAALAEVGRLMAEESLRALAAMIGPQSAAAASPPVDRKAAMREAGRVALAEGRA